MYVSKRKSEQPCLLWFFLLILQAAALTLGELTKKIPQINDPFASLGPLGGVKNMKVTNPTMTSLTVNWDPADGAVRLYKVFFVPTAGGREEMVRLSDTCPSSQDKKDNYGLYVDINNSLLLQFDYCYHIYTKCPKLHIGTLHQKYALMLVLNVYDIVDKRIKNVRIPLSLNVVYYVHRCLL